MQDEARCPCGLGASTEECCGRYIHGGQEPPTAEALMRSRYTAYVLGEIDHIVSTHDPAKREEMDPEGAKQWSAGAEWEGLEVHHAAGGPDDDTGEVEFTASYTADGKLFRHRERAEFRKIGGVWKYHDGEMIKPKPVVRAGRKVGRNEACPCGSGKKYKKCCGR